MILTDVHFPGLSWYCSLIFACVMVIVSVCTSPDFVPDKLEKDLMDVLSGFMANEHKKKMRNKAPQPIN